jgi:hypothetical protein
MDVLKRFCVWKAHIGDREPCLAYHQKVLVLVDSKLNAASSGEDRLYWFNKLTQLKPSAFQHCAGLSRRSDQARQQLHAVIGQYAKFMSGEVSSDQGYVHSLRGALFQKFASKFLAQGSRQEALDAQLETAAQCHEGGEQRLLTSASDTRPLPILVKLFLLAESQRCGKLWELITNSGNFSLMNDHVLDYLAPLLSITNAYKQLKR